MKKRIKFISSRIWKLSVLILLVGFFTIQANAQQSAPPFTLDLNLGGGLIGDPNVNTVFQPELGFSYFPGKWGVGLNTGFLSYNSSFDADNYTEGFEDFTYVASSKEKWSSFFIGAGPRFEFGSRLPVKLKGGLDLLLTYNSPPDISVAFDDANDNFPGVDLQLSELNSGDNYSKWSAALRPQFQIQFSPDNSDRFGINITTGLQHRLSKNEFTYSQRDLSDVQSVDNDREMFFQFEAAPEVQRTERPAQTNFFANVGVIIKFGRSKTPDVSQPLFAGNQVSAAQDYNSSRSNKPTTRANDTSDDCDDSGPCQHPDDAVELAQDYNSSRSNKPRTIADLEDVFDIDLTNSFIIRPRSSGTGDNPLYSDAGHQAENPLYEGQTNNNDGDGDGQSNAPELAELWEFDLDPGKSHHFNTIDNAPVEKERGMSAAGQSTEEFKNVPDDDYADLFANASFSISKRSARTGRNPQTGKEIQSSGGDQGDNAEFWHFDVQFDEFVDLDSDDDGIPDMVENATFSISKRSARTGRSAIYEPETTTGSSQIYESDNAIHHEDSEGQIESRHFILNVKRSGDIDSDGDGLPEVLKNASFSISKRSARTGRSGIHEPETTTSTSPLYESNRNANDGGGQSGEADQIELWHFDLQLDTPEDPNSDGDGILDTVENASFSISKRSARTGRN